MIVALLLQAAQPAQAPPVEGATVTVTARDPAASQAALAACLARHCPPKEDIAASIAYAEDQFVTGAYEESWVTLRRSRGRNDRFASTVPEDVAGLRQFSADVASVMGDSDMARVGTIDALSALKAGRRDAVALENKRLEVGDAFVRASAAETGTPLVLRSKIQMAVATYDAVAARAERAGLGDLRGRAMLRGAALYAQLAGGHALYQSEANRRIAILRATTDPAMQRYRDAALLLAARAAYDRGDHAPIERLLAQADLRTPLPALVIAPRIDLNMTDPCNGGSGGGGRNGTEQWVDYDFFVTRDGRVADVVERRRGPHAGGRWIDAALRSLAGRRYLPLAIPAGSAGMPRLERFILVSERGVGTGSRLESQCGIPSVLTMDLTATDTPRAAAR